MTDCWLRRVRFLWRLWREERLRAAALERLIRRDDRRLLEDAGYPFAPDQPGPAAGERRDAS